MGFLEVRAIPPYVLMLDARMSLKFLLAIFSKPVKSWYATVILKSTLKLHDSLLLLGLLIYFFSVKTKCPKRKRFLSTHTTLFVKTI